MSRMSRTKEIDRIEDRGPWNSTLLAVQLLASGKVAKKGAIKILRIPSNEGVSHQGRSATEERQSSRSQTNEDGGP